jgi:hypothetical protein
MTEKSLEAKTGHGQDRYSIEFHTDGRLQDVEIYRSWDQLDGALRSMIDEHLASRFNPYKIEKVQVQYSGEAAAVRDLILTGGSGDKVTTRYELVVDGVAEGRRDLWEFTFSADGSYEKSKKIILRSSENLEF